MPERRFNDHPFAPCMASIPTLRALLIERLKELYEAEHSVIKTLPRMIRAAANPLLKKAFDQNLSQTRRQVIRLAESQRTLGLPPTGNPCRAVSGLMEDAGLMVDLCSPPAVRDAALIGAVQRIQLYEWPAIIRRATSRRRAARPAWPSNSRRRGERRRMPMPTSPAWRLA